MQVRQATDTINNVDEYIRNMNNKSATQNNANSFLARPEKAKENIHPVAVDLVLKIREAFNA